MVGVFDVFVVVGEFVVEGGVWGIVVFVFYFVYVDGFLLVEYFDWEVFVMVDLFIVEFDLDDVVGFVVYLDWYCVGLVVEVVVIDVF